MKGIFGVFCTVSGAEKRGEEDAKKSFLCFKKKESKKR